MNNTENISIILVVLSSAVVSAIISGLFALFMQRKSAHSEQKAWLRDKKYELYFEIIAQIKYMRTLSMKVDPEIVLSLSQKLGLLLEDEQKFIEADELIIDIYNSYTKAIKSGKKSGTAVDNIQERSMTLIAFLRENLHNTK